MTTVNPNNVNRIYTQIVSANNAAGDKPTAAQNFVIDTASSLINIAASDHSSRNTAGRIMVMTSTQQFNGSHLINDKETPALILPPKQSYIAPTSFLENIREKIGAIVKQLREDHGIPSISIGITSPHGNININSGIKNQETGEAINQDTQFMIGSVTKLFTATLIMQEVEAGRISLDHTIADILPEQSGKITNANKITVRQLLQHRSGLADTPMLEYNAAAKTKYASSPGRWDSQSVVNSLEGQTAAFEPNEKYEYNNSAYAVLGAMIEKLSGKPIEQVLQEKIAQPLGLANTQFGLPANDNLASSYTRFESLPAALQRSEFQDGQYQYAASNGQSRFDSTPLHSNNQFLPQGGLISNVRDMQKFTKALFQSEKLLKRSTVEQMYGDATSAIYPDHGGHLFDYGLGMNIEGAGIAGSVTPGIAKAKRDQIGPSYGHAGNLLGYQADLRWYPKHNVGFTLNTNLGAHETNNAIYAMVKEKLFNDPEIFDFLFGQS